MKEWLLWLLYLRVKEILEYKLLFYWDFHRLTVISAFTLLLELHSENLPEHKIWRLKCAWHYNEKKPDYFYIHLICSSKQLIRWSFLQEVSKSVLNENTTEKGNISQTHTSHRFYYEPSHRTSNSWRKKKD